MLPYIGLIAFILIVSLLCAVIKKGEYSHIGLLLSVMAIFLMFALKATSVGIDTVAYKNMYDVMATASWNHFDLFWTEWGYELLEMVFTHIFRLPFQWFTAIIYAVVSLAYFMFWKKYSQDFTLSVMVYICFGAFVFDLSGLRNTLALALFLFAVPFAEKKGVKNIVCYFVLILIAAQIHNSAYIGFLMYFFIRRTMPRSAYVILPIVAIALRGTLAPLIKEISNKDLGNEVQLGGNVITYIMVLLIPVLFSIIWQQSKQTHNGLKEDDSLSTYYSSISMPMRVFYLSVMMLIFAGDTTFSRVSNYGLFFVTILLPNSLTPLEKSTRAIIKVLLYVALIFYFWYFKLRVNDLNMLPYVTLFHN